MHQDILLKIKPLAEKELDRSGYCLVDMRFYKDSLYRLVLEVLADRKVGGITLDECARLNKELGAILEQSAIISMPFVLDVSSPGLDRPLVTVNDFLRAKGKEIRIFLRADVEGRIEYLGTIESVQDDKVVIKTTTKTIEIPFDKVNKAKRVIL